MQSKLSRYADGVMEAAWLATIILTPILFNKYSARIFEPDKATLLRTLALITLCAWIVKIIENGIEKNTQIEDSESMLKWVLKVPIIAPVVVLALAYLIATIFSVAPRISFWGSYQRLQGTYTAFSYLVFFAAIAGNLRKREQVNRIITVAILTSLPVSLYGVLQHYGIDPIPWGGDVTRRVASNMGNSIFVAAYLILVVPLTIGRIVESFRAILTEDDGLGSHIARSTIYIFIGALEIIALYFSGSRGPLLGFLSGTFFLSVLLSLYWRKRWMTLTAIALAAGLGGFLILFNIPNSPIQSLRDNPAIGRLGRVFETEGGTGRVRVLIWEGAAKMIAPHEPLEYPNGDKDTFNVIRPLIGYGPETMHMAYNPFYPPELGHIEKRNASPDRSHNETWDTLVITGVFGLIAYLGVFGAVFYYGLKWIGLIVSERQRNLFWGLYIGGGVLGALGFVLWQGIGFFGVGLPFGIILGILSYLTLIALFSSSSLSYREENSFRDLTLVILLSAITAHFVEINFGIAIVATRTYFWIFAALLLSVGTLIPKEDLSSLVASPQPPIRGDSQKRKRRQKKYRSASRGDQPKWLRDVFIGTGITSIFLIALNYEFIANLPGSISTIEIFWSSLTRVQGGKVSYGVLALIVTAWLSASIVLASERTKYQKDPNWWRSFGGIAGLSALIGLIYSLWLSGSLAYIARIAPTNQNEVIQQVAGFEGLLTQFYTFSIIILLAMAAFLPKEWPIKTTSSFLGPLIAPVLFVLVIILANFTNLRIIRADITFKMAEPFGNNNQWPVAILLYQRARGYAPEEDYYYLFLGRAYLEYAKGLTEQQDKREIFNQAENDLLEAQKINRLNPDHTANLARLHSWWALQADNNDDRIRRGQESDKYYARATVLSPYNARLWNEWAILHLNILNQTDRANELLLHSLEIDPEYDWTNALLGDYYVQIARQTDDPDLRSDYLEKAAYHYDQAITWASGKTLKSRQGLNYFFALASVYQGINDIKNTITTLEASLEYAQKSDDLWKIEENLVQFYLQINDRKNAIEHARKALEYAPDAEKTRIKDLISQLENSGSP